MYITRYQETHILNDVERTNQIIIIYGARQVGKTTMIKHVLQKIDGKTLEINAEELKYHSVLSNQDLSKMKELVAGYDILFIDEAQKINNIGINIKILHDAMPTLKIILSGSSSFDLANKLQEPLTGRTKTYMLYPIGFCELQNLYNSFELKQKLEEFLVLGAYPRLLHIEGRENKTSHLKELSGAYLYKDILELANVKHSNKLYSLLRLLAFQVGSLVSIHELSNSLELSSETVERYIDLLEKSFVITRLSGFSKNLRKEISKRDKIYFYDLGIRNAIINNFETLTDRTDVGQLWENFLVTERLKANENNQNYVNRYFWRTYTGAELDYVEEKGGKLYGFEFKFGTKKQKIPKTWIEIYSQENKVINKENYIDFIT